MSGNKPDPGRAGYPDTDVDDPENPEWSQEDFARARPAQEVIPASLLNRLTQGPAAGPLRYQIYRGKGGDYRWRLLGPGGEVLANGADGYVRKSELVEAIDLIRSAIAEHSVIEEAA